MQVREKVGKLGNTLFFQCFVAPDGRKVTSLKRRVRSQLARWEHKTPQLRSTFRSCDEQLNEKPEGLLDKTQIDRQMDG